VSELRSNRIMVRTHCVHCGDQIETELEIYRGEEVLNVDLLKKGDVFPEDPYTYVHLLCEKCSLRRGVQDGADETKK